MDDFKLNEKYETPYLRELSIQDHCREVMVLYDMQRKGKAIQSVNLPQIKEALANESVDLMLILMKHYGQDTKRIDERKAKFLEKERLEKEGRI